jgi:hypothetical protein
MSPVGKHKVPGGRGVRLTPRTPFSCCATCTDTCAFKETGCYVRTGATIGMARAQDEAARGHSAVEVIADEMMLIDRAFRRGVPQDGARGGRDLRLHVGGDVGTTAGAIMLSGAALRWRLRGGGQIWSYTHQWREIPRAAWGSDITVLASVETPEDIENARVAGYPSAIVVPKFPSKRAFRLPGTSAKLIPCPAETGKKTCAECRLCIDPDLLELNAAIAFRAHGPAARKVRETLVQLRVSARPVPQKAS